MEVNDYDGLPSGWSVSAKNDKFYAGFEDEQSQNSFFDMLENVTNINWKLRDLTDTQKSDTNFFSYFVILY